MNCTRHFLNFQWEHHSWRRHVSSAENVATHETNMWGRVVHGHSVRCHTQYVCETCGKTREDISCLCDTAQADACAIRLAWVDSQQAPK